MHRVSVVLKRVVVLAFGIMLAWFVVFLFYPFIDRNTPVVITILITYCFVAYIALPSLVRVWQLMQKPKHVPMRSQARDGWALDPINIAVVTHNQSEFIWAMQKAGWYLSDQPNLVNNIKFILAMALNRPYPTAPFGSHFLFGRRQDLGFQIPISNSPRKRHHVRFWRLENSVVSHEHNGFWRHVLGIFAKPRRKQIWLGAAVMDSGINIQTRTLQLDHGIESDTSTERDFIVASLKLAGVLKATTNIKAGEPLHTRHQGLREQIIADGYVKICELKRQLFAPDI